jgi:nucleoside phosphorylase
MSDIAQAVAPAMFITTGTGGAIGQDVLLGDVIVADEVRFDCVSQFKDEPWNASTYKTSPVAASVLSSIPDDLLKVNASRIPMGRSVPKMWHDKKSLIVTTDFFAFDDSTDHYKLQGLGRACDMGDAMVAQALDSFKSIKFFAIRNASDPQIPNPDNNINEAGSQSGKIYTKYGALTTAASVIATWAVITA